MGNINGFEVNTVTKATREHGKNNISFNIHIIYLYIHPSIREKYH